MDKVLLYKFFQGNATLAEEQTIREWMETSADNKKLFFEERKMFDALTLLTDEKAVEEASLKRTKKSISWFKDLGKVAAAAVVTLMVTFAYQHFTRDEALEAMQKLTVPAGQSISLRLADGTSVWLGSRTTMTYPAVFDGKNRQVFIDGQAYFEVSHNPRRPFIVNTAKGSVEVTGTKFDVEAYSDSKEFTTTLLQGVVTVKTPHGGEVTLKPQQAAYLLNGQLKTRPADDQTGCWREGIISFKNASFAEIMSKFEKCYGITIKIENKNVLDYHYTGKFRQTDGIEKALKVLQLDVHFVYEKDEIRHIIYIR